MPDALGHIAPTDIDLNYPAPDFLDIVLQTLGNAGDTSDGFEADYAQSVNDLGTILNDLDAVDFILGLDILLGDPTGESHLVENTPRLQADLANAQGDYNALTALALSVDIQPPPDSGGLGPGGPTPTTGGQPAACTSGTNEQIGFIGIADGTRQSFPLDLTSASEVSGDTIVSVTLDQDSDPTFSLESFAPVPTTSPTAQHAADVLWTSNTPGNYLAGVTVIYAQRGTIHLCIQVTGQ